MNPLTRPRGLVLLLAGVLLGVSPVLAQVRDSAGFFSEQAVQQANSAIQQFERSSQRQMVVETLENAPSTNFQQATRERFRQLGLDGIYVLITRNPSHLEVAVGDKTSTGFSPAQRTRLSEVMLQHFRSRQFDQGLLAGVQFVQQNYKASATANRSAATGDKPIYGYSAPQQKQEEKKGLGWFWWLIIIGLGVFLLFRFLRRRSAASGPVYGTPPGAYRGNMGYPNPNTYPGRGGAYGPAGGGFGRGMFGGLLGGMAGGWLYDKFRGHGGAGQGGAGLGGDPGVQGPLGHDTDAFTSGGDFGGGGGFDAGSGGGDFGGGGDSGTSGGDF